MVKKLKVDDSDQGQQQQPFQQQQQQQLQQLQQLQQVQQQTDTNGIQISFDDATLGASDIFQPLLATINDITAQSIPQYPNSSNSLRQHNQPSQLLNSSYQHPPACSNSTQISNTSVNYSSNTAVLSSTNPSLPVRHAQYISPQLPYQQTDHTIQNSNFHQQGASQRAYCGYQNNNLHNHHNQPSTSTSNLAPLHNQLPVTSAHTPSLQSGGSIALYKPPEGGAPSSIRDDMFSSKMAVSQGNTQWPVPKGYIENGGRHRSVSVPKHIDEIIQGKAMEPSQGPTVAQFPQRNNFSGIFGLQVCFPGESPKLVLKEDADGNRQLFTEMDHCITTVVKHSADQSAAMRFLIVFSKDSEATQPVRPCKNHQKAEHPNHMLEVRSGSSLPIWGEEPHPSIVVAPSPSSEGKYSVQLKFLCRNSCILRKNLTLICQLERDGQVVGRQCLELKISACPRRDAKMSTKTKEVSEVDVVVGEMESEHGRSGGFVTTNDLQMTDALYVPAVMQATNQSIDEAFSFALESGKRAAYLTYMEKKFHEMSPEQYHSAKAGFDRWWNSPKNSI